MAETTVLTLLAWNLTELLRGADRLRGVPATQPTGSLNDGERYQLGMQGFCLLDHCIVKQGNVDFVG